MSVIHASAQKGHRAFWETWKTWSIKSEFIFKDKEKSYVNLFLRLPFEESEQHSCCTVMLVAVKFHFQVFFFMFSLLNLE